MTEIMAKYEPTMFALPSRSLVGQPLFFNTSLLNFVPANLDRTTIDSFEPINDAPKGTKTMGNEHPSVESSILKSETVPENSPSSCDKVKRKGKFSRKLIKGRKNYGRGISRTLPILGK